MKKNLRYFPSRKIAIITILLITIIFKAKIGYCLDVADYGTTTFNEELETKLEEKFNFDNYLYSAYNSSITTSTEISICFFYNNQLYKYGNGTTIQYNYNNSWNNMKCIISTITMLNNAPNMELIKTIRNSNTIYRNNTLNSSINITDDGTENGNITITKNINYEKPTCPSSGEECGPVEITNFPIDKNEFYVLLLMLSTLIFMLFFKWCFPMKGGKK